MKRILSLLLLAWCCLAPTAGWSQSTLSALGAGSTPAAGGGTVTYDQSAISAAVEDAASATTSAQTISGAAGRYALVACLKNDGAQTLDTATLDGTSATAIAAQYTSDWHHARQYEIVNTAVTGASKSATCNASAAADRMLAAYIVYSGTNTTTPKNSTTTPTFGDDSTQPSATVTTVTGGVAVCVLSVTNGDDTLTITPGTGVTVRQQQRNVLGTLAILERSNNGGSTVVAASLSATLIVGWRQECYGIQP